MKLFFNSIKGQIFSWYLLTTTILVLLICFGIYIKIENTLEQSINEVMHSKMQVLLGLFHKENNGIELEIEESIYGEYTIPRSGHYYRVIINNKNIIFSQSLIKKDFKFINSKEILVNTENNEQVFISEGPDFEPVMVLNKKAIIFGIPTEITVAESMKNNLKILENLQLFLFVVIPLFILLIAFVAYYIAQKSLKPIDKFSQEVNQISHFNINKRINSAEQAEEFNNLTLSFNNMLERLDKAFYLEKLVVSEASHQLKTPVTVIKSHCDIILLKIRETKEYIEVITTIKQVSESMTKLINDMLSLARLDSGALKKESFSKISLNECLENSINLATPLIEKKKITIKTEKKIDIQIVGDKDKITEAIVNVLDNAIKYSPDDSQIVIKTEINDNYSCLSIKDNGMGIAKPEQEKIFERFYRADISNDVEGTGLGLSIAKSIIEIHGGMISLESEVGKGSCFTISFPYS